MFDIRLETQDIYHGSEITLRTDIKGWNNDIPGKHISDGWVFSLYEEDFVDGLSFKFVLERTHWMKGSDLFIIPISGQTYSYSTADIHFPSLQTVPARNPSIRSSDLNLLQLLLAGIGFLPLLGLPFSLIAIAWGLLVGKRRGTKLVILGAAGPILSLVLVVGFIAFVSPMIFYGPSAKERANKFLVTTLMGACDAIEAFKRASGRYPAKLNELTNSPKYLLTYDPFQPTQITKGYVKQPPFYYQRLSDPPGYYLFSVGKDGKAFTSDDVLPTPGKALPGLRIPSKPL